MIFNGRCKAGPLELRCPGAGCPDAGCVVADCAGVDCCVGDFGSACAGRGVCLAPLSVVLPAVAGGLGVLLWVVLLWVVLLWAGVGLVLSDTTVIAGGDAGVFLSPLLS